MAQPLEAAGSPTRSQARAFHAGSNFKVQELASAPWPGERSARAGAWAEVEQSRAARRGFEPKPAPLAEAGRAALRQLGG